MRQSRNFSIFFILTLLILQFFFLQPAFSAVGEICGSGVDEDSSGTFGSCGAGEVDGSIGVGCDLLCTGTDKDRDGFSVALGDCDDTDRMIFPSMPTTEGCAAGSYRVCASNGSGYGSCIVSATTPYCPEACGACKYANFVTGNDANPGTFASPWKGYLNFNSYYDPGDRPATWHDIQPGDCLGLMTGTYNQTISFNGVLQSFVIRSETCGTSNGTKCGLFGYPGQLPVIDAPGTSGSPVPAITLADAADNWFIQGPLDIKNTYTGPTNLSGNAGVVNLVNNNNTEIKGIQVHDNDCVLNENCCGLLFDRSHNHWVHHNFLYKNYDTTDTGTNNNQITDFRSNNPKIEVNTLFNDNANPIRGDGYIKKHVDFGDKSTFKRNIIYNALYCALWAGDEIDAQYNYCEESLYGFKMGDLGGEAHQTSGVRDFSFNTFKNVMMMWQYDPTLGYNINGTSAANACSGNSTINMSQWHHNIMVDDSAGYNQDESIYNFHVYGPDALYAALITADKLDIHHNCFFNTNSGAFRADVFTSNNGDTTCSGRGNNGTSYATWALWQAAGFDANSFNENPLLDASGLATSANCIGFGWNFTDSPPEPTPFPTPTPTPTATPTPTPTPPASGAVSADEQHEFRKFAGTNNIIHVYVKDTETGGGKTGLTFSTTGLVITAHNENVASATVYPAATSKIETIAALGSYATPTATKVRFREVDPTNQKGQYQIQLANSFFSQPNSKEINVCLSGAAGIPDSTCVRVHLQQPAFR